MRTFARGLAVFVLGWTAGLAAGAEKTTAAEVARLIGQLGSPRYAERQKATRALDALGPAALPALNQAARGKDAEIRRRALELLKVIGKRVEMETLVGATRVHLVLRDTPVIEAVAQLAKQTRFDIQVGGDRLVLAKRTITLDTGPTTFWQALDQLCQKAGLVERGLALAEGKVLRWTDFNRINPDATLVLDGGQFRKLPTHYFKGVRIRTLPNTIPLPGLINTGRDNVAILEAAVEPKTPLHKITGVRIARAADQHGIQVAASVQLLHVPENPYEFSGKGYGYVTPAYATRLENGMKGGNFRRVLVRVPATRLLKELRGTLIAEVQKPSEPLVSVANIFQNGGKTFDLPGAEALTVGKAERTGGGQISLEIESHFALNGFRGSITISNNVIRIRPHPNAPWQTVGLQTANLKLLDGAGKPLSLVRMQRSGLTFGRGGITQRLQLTFQGPRGKAEAVKLLYFGVKTVLVEVPFTLTNVPLR
jgi:hypothetical protein